MIDIKGHRFTRDIILICVRWYLAYPLSYRNLQEMMAERGVQVDHTNIYRWVQKFAPQLEAEFRRSGNKRPIGTSWRMDETMPIRLLPTAIRHSLSVCQPSCRPT